MFRVTVFIILCAVSITHRHTDTDTHTEREKDTHTRTHTHRHPIHANSHTQTHHQRTYQSEFSFDTVYVHVSSTHSTFAKEMFRVTVLIILCAGSITESSST